MSAHTGVFSTSDRLLSWAESVAILSSFVRYGKTVLFNWNKTVAHWHCFVQWEKLLLSPEEVSQGKTCSAEVTDAVCAWCWGVLTVPWCLLLSRLGASVAFPAAIHMLWSTVGAPQNLGLCVIEQGCAKVSDETWILAGKGCSSSSFERSWERLPKTTSGESVQMKDLVSLSVPSVVFSSSSVISCHFRIWAYWTSGSMD